VKPHQGAIGIDCGSSFKDQGKLSRGLLGDLDSSISLGLDLSLIYTS
jgi:hypothetical protein